MGPESSRAGLLLVDKPAGPTSHDVVERARRGCGIRRIGHTGTLDPFATGLLLLCVGRATRLAEYFHLLPKSYVATLRLGVETDTHDPTGGTTARDESWRDVSADELGRIAARFRGSVRQVPPTYSAKRVAGRRAHRVARAGERPELEPVEVQVHELEILDVELPRVRLAARVGTGTYIRALARDLGRELGCGAHLTELRRTDIGGFSVADAMPAASLDDGLPERGPSWRSPARALSFLPRRELTSAERERVRHGQPVEVSGRPDDLVPGPLPGDGARVHLADDDAPVAMVHGSRLVAVGERRDGRLHPRKVLDAP